MRETVARHVGAAQVVILSDYAKGLLSPALIAFVMQAARDAGIAVFVDPKSPDFRHYRGASCIKPNLKELAAASGLAVGTEAEVAAASRKVMAEAEAGAILTTRSEHGMLLVEADGALHSAPSRAREVFDVSGAGDTAIAALALARASGRTLAQAMQFANAAAGVVVSKLGTATADVAEVPARTGRAGPRADGGAASVAIGRRGGAAGRALEGPGPGGRLGQRRLRHPASG